MILPLLLLALLPLVDAPTWHNHRQRVRRSAHDRSTALEITVLGGLGVLAALLVMPFVSGDTPRLAGVAIALLGGALRFWSIRTLGRFFTLTLQVNQAQPVIRAGPYRYVRHPSYLGGELALLGIGLTCGNWLSAMLMVTPMLIAHLRRIRVEEAMMHAAMGARWVDYTRSTARLLPFVY